MDSTAAFLNRLGRRNTVFLLVAVVIAAIIIALVCFAFTVQIAQETSLEAERDLTEISIGVADTVNSRMDGILNTIESIAATYSDFSADELDHQAYLHEKRETLEFTELAVVGSDGTGVDADGEPVDYSDLPGVMGSLEGKESFSSTELGENSEDALLYYAAPIQEENGSVVGALVVFNNPTRMREILSVESFGGEGFSQLVNTEGDFIVSSTNKNAPLNATNFFEIMAERGSVDEGYSLDQMRSDMAEGNSGILEFQLDGISKIMNYRPLNQEGLYLFSVVPTDVAFARFDQLGIEAVIVNVVIVAVLATLILLILFTNRRHQKRLEDIAFVDPVTDGHNKAWFILEAEGRIGEAPPNTYTLVSVDVQRFKLINDIFGTEKGDETLRHIYKHLDNRFGEDGLLCRYTADQFSILIDAVPAQDLLPKIDQVCKDINAFNDEAEEKYYLTLSFGIVEIDDPELPLTLIQDRADTARKNRLESISTSLYTCVFYSDLERQRMLEEKEMENSMEGALEAGEFIMYLQPKIGLEKRCLVGAEALARWDDPVKGLIRPDLFIPLFERNGFVVKLDIYIFEQACKTLRGWIDQGRKPVPLSVNLSRVHLGRANFLDPYIEIRDRYKIPSDLLEFEFTESMVFEDLEIVRTAIDHIHEQGFRCAIDDFGSGYSSFNMLKDVDADVLKIDGAFFSQEGAGEREQAIVESIVVLAKRLHMTTIAEGVEHESTLEYLSAIGCDAVQGYVFSRPLPVEEFESFGFRFPSSDKA